MEGFKKNPKLQCFKEGGQVKYESRKEHKEEVSADIAQDKKIVKKAFKLHDAQEHKGESTDLSKLKKGGRAKKSAGTVKKYCGGKMVKKADGGIIDTIKDAGVKLKDNILGTPEQNRVAQANLDKQAAQDSKLAKMLGGKAK